MLKTKPGKIGIGGGKNEWDEKNMRKGGNKWVC
jgi:hypothetical protein